MKNDIRRGELNTQQRKALKAETVRLFAHQIGRKAQKSSEPNDRKHSREVEQQINQMDPFELDKLLDGED
jgi:hypothetical protein